jgi:1,4-alpha-glucan branching enzyme
VKTLVRDLNRLYRATPALHQLDCDAAGFEWVVADDTDQSVFVWLRKGREANERCLVAVNFTPQVRRDYRFRVPRGGYWREVLNTDAAIYGGGDVGNSGGVNALEVGGGYYEVNVTLPPLAAVFFTLQG